MDNDDHFEEYETYVPPLMCFACEHFFGDSSRHRPAWRRGECRRLSPATVGSADDTKAVWPSVSELDWCGDGRRKNIG